MVTDKKRPTPQQAILEQLSSDSFETERFNSEQNIKWLESFIERSEIVNNPMIVRKLKLAIKHLKNYIKQIEEIPELAYEHWSFLYKQNQYW